MHVHVSTLLSQADVNITVKEATPASLWVVEGFVDPL